MHFPEKRDAHVAAGSARSLATQYGEPTSYVSRRVRCGRGAYPWYRKYRFADVEGLLCHVDDRQEPPAAFVFDVEVDA